MTDLTYPKTMISPKWLKLFQPVELKRDRLFRRVPPLHFHSFFARKIAIKSNRSNPGKVLKIYEKYAKRSDDLHMSVLLSAFCAVGESFHPNCFFATGDRQLVVGHDSFKRLCADICERKEKIHTRQVGRIIC